LPCQDVGVLSINFDTAQHTLNGKVNIKAGQTLLFDFLLEAVANHKTEFDA